MKTFFSKIGLGSVSVSMLLMTGALFTVSACKENISEDNYAIAQKKTV